MIDTIYHKCPYCSVDFVLSIPARDSVPTAPLRRKCLNCHHWIYIDVHQEDSPSLRPKAAPIRHNGENRHWQYVRDRGHD